MEIDEEKFKKKYPHIAEEIASNFNKIKIESRRIKKSAKKIRKKGFQGYNPTIIDFIRRCNNYEEAESIIVYLEERGEISKKYSNSIRKQLKEKGIRSFGSKKEENYYFKNSKIE
jgi:hypothetical protein